ncbi:MAG: hypothetical protein J5685_11020 [Clostridiales bacterium]|nr:hypothetical protein [Clostridiales bacterium]
MGQGSKRAAAALLAVVMTMSHIFTAGCSKRPETSAGYEVSDCWYEYKCISIGDYIDLDEFDAGYSRYKFLGVVGEKLAFFFHGTKILREEGTSYILEESHDYMLIFDKQGNHEQTVDLNDLIDAQYPRTVSHLRLYDNVESKGDKIKIDFSYTDIGGSGLNGYSVIFDPADGSVTDLDELEEITDGFIDSLDIISAKCDGHYVHVYLDYGLGEFNDRDVKVDITDPSGETETVSFYDFDRNLCDSSVSVLFRLSENCILMRIDNYDWVRYVQLDLDSKELSYYDADLSFLDDLSFYQGFYIEGIGNIISSDYEIKTVDLTEGTVSTYFDYNCCNMNMMLLQDLYVDYVDSDTIIMSGDIPLGNNMFDVERDTHRVFVLTRSENNPNEGKEIIRAASLTPVSYIVAEGVSEYNARSTTHRIIFDPRYNMYDPDTGSLIGAGTDLSNESIVYNRLMIDLMSGDGPDIIFDAYGLLQLCDDQYLIDLSDLTLPDDAFSNVFEALRTDGKLYNIPLAFIPHGLVMRSGDTENGRVGFTFDQYDEMVHDICNGRDPTAIPRESFFIRCLSQSGITDFRSDEFWELAEYSRDRYLEPAFADDMTVYDYWAQGASRVKYFDMDHPYCLAEACDGVIDDMVLMGLPSTGATGPNIRIMHSVAVTASTAYEQQCREFISLLISPDLQDRYRMGDYCPVSRSGVETQIREVAESYNRLAEYAHNLIFPETMIDFGYDTEYMDPDVFVQVYEAMIDRCNGVGCIDTEQEIIIREEMGAYFADQKTPEEIADLIEDRLSTLANERG